MSETWKVGRASGIAQSSPTAYVYDERDKSILCYARMLGEKPIGEQLIDMRRIAAALNRDETRKPNDRWSTDVRDGWTVIVTCDGLEVSPYVLAKLLNKLGATLPKRSPARKGQGL